MVSLFAVRVVINQGFTQTSLTWLNDAPCGLTQLPGFHSSPVSKYNSKYNISH